MTLAARNAGLAFLLALPLTMFCQTAVKQHDWLADGFRHPPESAKPRVWWHWMNGNVTPEGIRLDMNWIQRIGIGGFAVFQGSLGTPRVVEHPLDYMSPDWKRTFKEAMDEAIKMKFEVTIAASAGWSETGGPWVKPAEAMKKLVWSSLDLEGGTMFRGMITPLPHSTGTFQNYKLKREGILATQLPTLAEYYNDVAVIAYPIPDAEKTQSELKPDITAHGGLVNPVELADGDVETAAATLVADASNDSSYILFDYRHPQAIQAISIATTNDIVSFFGFDETHSNLPVLQASDDGTSFRDVVEITHSSIPQRTIGFPEITARYFRVVFPKGASIAGRKNIITELVLHSSAQTNQWERRAGFATAPNYYDIPDFSAASESTVSKANVIDLTNLMKPDGSLEWDAPPGRWRILRMGQSLVGRENEPAPAEATGLEVDKLNAAYVRNYLNAYLSTYRDTVGASLIGKRGITHLLTDSVEIGSQNWTDTMLADFQRLRGYDARPWLPALTGVVIDSTVDTDRFLWDFRQTIAQLFAQNHYAVLSDELHRQGLRSYGEALEFRRPSLGDDMEMRSHTDIPMSAMWSFKEENGPNPTYVADVRGAASVGHVYGQNLVAAESMTAGPPPWSWSPNSLKRIADLEFALGVNRIEIHESTHQPWRDKVPGLTLGEYGQWFNRNETWANDAKPWIDYLARNSYMLQQGHYYADVAYFYGEEAPLTSLFGTNRQTDEPQGYGFDFINGDALLNRMKVFNGRLTTGTGVNYRVLVLGGTSSRMTVPILRKIASLVEAGATLIGKRPQDSPSLADSPSEFRTITDKLWGGSQRDGFFVVGKGRVYRDKSLNEVLRSMGVPQDFSYSVPAGGAPILFLHRQTKKADIYFVDSRSQKAEEVDATFRCSTGQPELWDAATGESRLVPYHSDTSGTSVRLHLDPYGTVFVVFRHDKSIRPAPRLAVECPLVQNLNLDGGWQVSFQPRRGAPAQVNFDHLSLWNTNSESGIRFFSGTAVYSRDVTIPAASLRSSARVWLDLGSVYELASVKINGKSLGVAWKTPYRLDATKVLRPGLNHLQVSVTNLWVNRLIGDAQPDATQKYTYTDIVPYKANSPLLPSGLLGPVRFVSEILEN